MTTSKNHRSRTVRRLFPAAAFAFAVLAAAAPAHRAAAQTTVDGGQTLNLSSDMTYSSGLIVGNTSTGTVNQTGGTVTVSSPFTLGNQAGSVGYYNLSGGTLNVPSAQFTIGNSGQGNFVQTGNSTVNTSTFSLQFGNGNCSYSMGPGGTFNATTIFSVKIGNTYTQTGGTATIGTGTTSGVFRVYGGSPLNLSGGTLTATSTNPNIGSGNLIGWFAGTGAGTVNVSGTGALAFTGTTVTVGLGESGIINLSGNGSLSAPKGITLGTQVTMGSNATLAGSGTINLNGGTLTTAAISTGAAATVGTTTYAPGTGTLNLNGGTLAASADSGAFVGGLTTANVRNGGAVLDSNGFNVTVGQALLHSTISGDNATDGGLTKNGAGTLTLTGANTYTGATTINNGIVALGGGRLYNNGMTAGSVVVNNGGLLRLDSNDTFGDASAQTPVSFTVNAGGRVSTNGTFNTLNNVTLNGGALEANGSSASTGAFGFAGTITATGAQVSTINAGGVNPANFARLGANNTNGAVGTATFAVTDAGGRLNVAIPLANNFNSTGALVKNGAGTLALNAANTYTGPTTVNAGTLLVNGSTAAGTTITLAAGTTLGGTGTINGAVVFGANTTLAPGGVGGTGIATLAGGLTLASTSRFAAELNGATAGSGYDRVAVVGNVALNGATLQLTLGYTPTVGDRLFIIDNDGIDAVTGTFAGLANGQSFTVGGQNATISYNGDTTTGLTVGGNDVVLTFVGVPEPSTWALLAAGAGLLGCATLRRRNAV